MQGLASEVAGAAGSGASGEGNTKGWGNRPFLDLLDVESGEKERLWQSSPPAYEFSGSLLVDTNSDEPIRYTPCRMLEDCWCEPPTPCAPMSLCRYKPA